jgi:uncharacterized protein (DUF1330 family)
MPCFFIAQINVHDKHEYARYLEGAGELLDRFSGKVIAVDEQAVVLEGEWPFGRTVLIEFPSMADLERWYHSPEYQRLADHRKAGSTANIVAARGRD